MSTILAFVEDKMADELSPWFYRGEGNDTLVVGLQGYNLVLRLKKKLRSKPNKINKAIYADEEQKRAEELLNFSRHVFFPLMGKRYVPFGVVLNIHGDFARKLDKLCESSRPRHRLHKGIDTGIPYAVIMPDFCFLPVDKPVRSCKESLLNIENFHDNKGNSSPTFSVEIKPKCGFLPTSTYIQEALKIKHSVCYYCMLQSVKVSEGKYSRKSKYCPVNLLSGDPCRVFYALKSLVSDPQNNFRVFRDGIPIFTHEIVQDVMAGGFNKTHCPEDIFENALKDYGWEKTVGSDSHRALSNGFLYTILQILIHDSKINESNVCKDTNVQRCLGNGKEELVHEDNVLKGIEEFGCGGVLQTLKNVQKLDHFDVEGLYPVYRKVKDYFNANENARMKSTVDGPYLSSLWGRISASFETQTEIDERLEKWSIDEAILRLCQFLVASTAKDCSIMLTFQAFSTPPKYLPFIEIEGKKESFAYSINLVDLDPKEFDRITKYYKDTCTTTQHYLKNSRIL